MKRVHPRNASRATGYPSDPCRLEGVDLSGSGRSKGQVVDWMVLVTGINLSSDILLPKTWGNSDPG